MSKPDLTCAIEAYGPDGEVVDGERVAAAVGDEARLVFTVRNNSDARSGPFWLRPSVRVNGEKAHDPDVEMISLDPGESQRYEFSRPFAHGDERWEAQILVDIGDFVEESNEINNWVTFTFVSHTAGHS